MPSHLSSIGLPVNDQADFAALADRIGPLATPIEVSQGAYWRWSSECGAEMWLQSNTDNELVGMTPFFSGDARTRVRLTARVTRPDDTPLEGAFHGWAAPDQSASESGEYPFVFDAIDYGRYNQLVLPAIVDVQIAAFAHEIALHQTLDAYNASQTGSLRSHLFRPDCSHRAASRLIRRVRWRSSLGMWSPQTQRRIASAALDIIGRSLTRLVVHLMWLLTLNYATCRQLLAV
jgi:hypothetical protein